MRCLLRGFPVQNLPYQKQGGVKPKGAPLPCCFHVPEAAGALYSRTAVIGNGSRCVRTSLDF